MSYFLTNYQGVYMIKFIGACDGYIELTDTSGKVTKALTATGVTDTLVIFDGLADDAMASSSMDFAKEYGFSTHGDAWAIFNKGLADYQAP